MTNDELNALNALLHDGVLLRPSCMSNRDVQEFRTKLGLVE